MISQNTVTTNMMTYKERLFQHKNLFSMNKIDIISDFCDDIFSKSIDDDYKEIRNLLITHTNLTDKDIPKEKDEFYNFLFNSIIVLRKAPNEELNIILRKILEVNETIDEILLKNEKTYKEFERKLAKKEKDIKDINQTITKKKKAFEDYSTDANRKKELTHSEVPEVLADIDNCNFYIELLKTEKNRLQNLNYKEIAKDNSQFLDTKYKYSFSDIQTNPGLYIAKNNYSIPIKFAKEVSQLYKEIEKYKYEENYKQKLEETFNKYPYHSNELERIKRENISDYKDKLSSYINDYKVCEYLKTNTSNNHILFNRKTIIDHSIELFEKQDYLNFINLITIQIEGLFFDICEELGSDPDRTSSHTLKPKLDYLSNKILFDEVSYFKFYFPLVRNKVAHGIFMESKKLDIIAYETLLDLQFLVHLLITHEKIPYNKALRLIKSLKINNRYHEIRIKDYLLQGDIYLNLNWLVNSMYNEVYEFYDEQKIIPNCMETVKDIRLLLSSDNLLKILKQNYVYFLNQNKVHSAEEILTLLRAIQHYCLKYVPEKNELIISLLREIKKYDKQA